MSARRLLVVPLLSPLLAVLLVAALNPSPKLSFRLLTWATPQAPLGLWLGGAALGGAVLSGAGTALALRQGQPVAPKARRRVTTARSSRSWAGSEGDGGWETLGDDTPSSWRRSRQEEGARDPDQDRRGGAWRQAVAAVAPPRSPSEPAPTVDVPFRILHRPGAGEGERVAATRTAGQGRAAMESEGMPVAAADDWGREVASDDW
jgi:hypothetical protein